MGNTAVNLILTSIFAIIIVTLALLAISEPISRMRATKKSLEEIIGGEK